MSLPQTALPPPFHVTRASHAVITVSDLGKSRAFYVDGIGLVASDETSDAIYLRGVSYTRQRGWGLPPQRKWHFEASRFAGAAPRDPARMPDPYTLEKYLAEQAAA